VVLTSASSTASAGNITPSSQKSLLGQSAQGSLGYMEYHFWSTVDDSQTPNWVVVSTN
jgi:hypothetical protein